MEEAFLDLVLVPLGLLLFGIYHAWLFFTIRRNPRRTVIGLNAESRQQWVFSMMDDPLKNGVLTVQTIRNNIMASTLLGTTAITLSSLIGVFVSSSSKSGDKASQLVYGNKTLTLSSIKYFCILLCFLVAFLCNVQSIRYYAHNLSITITDSTITSTKQDNIEYGLRENPTPVLSSEGDCENGEGDGQEGATRARLADIGMMQLSCTSASCTRLVGLDILYMVTARLARLHRSACTRLARTQCWFVQGGNLDRECTTLYKTVCPLNKVRTTGSTRYTV
ncbi:hypothetical protein L484_013279 [Morus notabilis]|uniref:Uncharacterized protein n=1 Tax=Morus notabilis TaxID=981085 RepID=W9SET2_9ROSA|nr:hypothetical protein L484_013279 [Morus notabilis]